MLSGHVLKQPRRNASVTLIRSVAFLLLCGIRFFVSACNRQNISCDFHDTKQAKSHRHRDTHAQAHRRTHICTQAGMHLAKDVVRLCTHRTKHGSYHAWWSCLVLWLELLARSMLSDSAWCCDLYFWHAPCLMILTCAMIHTIGSYHVWRFCFVLQTKHSHMNPRLTLRHHHPESKLAACRTPKRRLLCVHALTWLNRYMFVCGCTWHGNSNH